jgi:hypothetical protein
VAALLAGVIWAAVGAFIVLFALWEFLSLSPYLLEKEGNSSGLTCVAFFGAGFVLVGVQTVRCRLKALLAIGVGSAVLGALALGGLLYLGARLNSPACWVAAALLSAGVLAIRGRQTYRARGNALPGGSPAGVQAASGGKGADPQGLPGPGYQEAARLAFPWTAAEKETPRWTAVFDLPGRPGLSWPYRLVIAAFVYLAGVVLAFGVVALWSWGCKARDVEPSQNATDRIMVTFVAVILGSHWVARRVVAPRARELARRDRRPPVLLLRAFADDQNEVGLTGGPIGLRKRSVTLEEVLAGEFAQLGPVIAVGRPGELLPPAGAGRLWLDNSAWQKGVDVLLEECQYVVLVVGRIRGRDGLAWEVEQIKSRGLLPRLVLVMPAVSEGEAEERWDGLAALLDGQLPPYVPFVCFAGRSPSGLGIVVRGSGERRKGDYQGKVVVVP